MISQDLMRLMQQEREREIEAELRVRRLLGVRRPFIRWRPTQGRLDGGPDSRRRA